MIKFYGTPKVFVKWVPWRCILVISLDMLDKVKLGFWVFASLGLWVFRFRRVWLLDNKVEIIFQLAVIPKM
jgi:hypothetical protein